MILQHASHSHAEEARGLTGLLGLGVTTLDFCFSTDLLFLVHACKLSAGCHSDMYACLTDIISL